MAAYDWSKGLVKGLFWGGLIGVVIGILFTTKRDKGTWEKIGRSADELFDKTQEQVGQARREMEELANREKNSYAGEKESLNQSRGPTRYKGPSDRAEKTPMKGNEIIPKGNIMKASILSLMVAVVALSAISAPLYASRMDDRIESSARKSYIFQTYLTG